MTLLEYLSTLPSLGGPGNPRVFDRKPQTVPDVLPFAVWSPGQEVDANHTMEGINVTRGIVTVELFLEPGLDGMTPNPAPLRTAWTDAKKAWQYVDTWDAAPLENRILKSGTLLPDGGGLPVTASRETLGWYAIARFQALLRIPF
jgi:hypothetical protein